MKLYKIYLSFLFISLICASCKKTVIISQGPGQPIPTDVAEQRSFKIALESLPNYHNIPDGLSAVVTIEPAAGGQPITITSNLAYDQHYQTSTMSLPKGAYKIKGMIIKNQNGSALFASPVTGSVKAALVNKPLSIALVLDEKTAKMILLQVLSVTAMDLPQSFGYADGSFGHRPGNPDSEMDKQIIIRPIIRVGQVVYDSIPAQLIIKSWDAKNEMTYNIHYLKGGSQGIYLSAKAVKHQLSVSKWGSYDEFTLNKADIQEGIIYDIGGDVDAKKLKTVYEYKIVNGISTPVTKTDYEYHNNGYVKQKLVLGKKADLSNYLAQIDVYEYSNNKISAIKSYDQHNALVKTTTIQYQNSGKRIASIEEKSSTQTIQTTASYTTLETRSGINLDYRIDATYNYGQGTPQTYLSKTMHGGAVLTDIIASDNGNREEGLYEYDFCINPYAHLDIPDKHFLLYEKHNLTFQWKTYYGGYPENEAYAFSYTYDGDGYPTERFIKYRSYRTKNEVYTLRTAYVYY